MLPFLNQPAWSRPGSDSPGSKKLIKAKRLKPGDTVGVIAPASSASAETFAKALQNLSDLGFRTKVGQYAQGEKGFLSGTDKERLHDLHWAFGDKEVDAVWCVRGGYGLSRLLPDVDFPLIKKNPKIFIGYSDITALHVAIFQNTGLVTFHGPVAASEMSDYSKTHVVKPSHNTLTGRYATIPTWPSRRPRTRSISLPGTTIGSTPTTTSYGGSL